MKTIDVATKQTPATVVAFVQRAIAVLKANGIAYKIVMPDGVVHDTLPKEPEKKQKLRQRRVEGRMWGELSAYVTPFLTDVQPGQVVEIPMATYTADEVRSSVTARASQMWGNGSYTSAINAERHAVEILRIQ